MPEFEPFHFEPVRGAPKPRSELQLGGLDRIKLDASGAGQAAPISHLTGMRPTSARAGQMEFVLPASAWLSSSDGTIGSTAATFLTDAPIGGACMSAQGPWTLVPTAEISYVYVGSATSGSSLAATGSLVTSDDVSAVATAIVQSDTGQTLALSSTRCMIREIVPDDSPPPSEVPADTELTDPYLRPATGRPLTTEEVGERTGREIVAAMVGDDLPSAPIAHLLGLRPIASDDGLAMVEMVASGWHVSPGGMMYGGSLAAGAEYTLALAALTLAQPGQHVETLDLKVNYVRPVAGDGAVLRLDGSLEHAGRRVVVGKVRGTRPDGKPVFLATGTVLVGSRNY